MEPVRVLIVDDHRMMRDGLKALLRSQPDMQVVGEAENGRVGMRLAADASPDVIVMDVTMPELNGIDATHQIHVKYPGVKVVALSAHPDRRFASGMIEAGAAAYVTKDTAFEELVTAIHSVVNGQVYLSPRVAAGLIDQLRDSGGNGNGGGATGMAIGSRAVASLSPREREVLQLISEGNATKEVAAHLNLSVKTVETHRKNIMDKLNVQSVAELTKYAIREGITSLEH
jgi:DNA-binding NarL/FixJ family response regulator